LRDLTQLEEHSGSRRTTARRRRVLLTQMKAAAKSTLSTYRLVQTAIC
jgi:hypothetical protein